MNKYKMYNYNERIDNTLIMIRDIDYFANFSFKLLERRLKVKEKLEEPDYTAAIATIFPRLLNTNHVLGDARIGGCYIHQKPKVEFYSETTKKIEQCEAGDLLLLCKRSVDGKQQLNATLFQIKMHSSVKDKHRIKQDEKVQMELYQKWPIFTIPSVTTNTVYDIRPKAITPGAQYLCISPMFDCSFRFLFHSLPASEMELYNQYTLGYFISNFIDWQNGRPISMEDDELKDVWSEFIWHLIGVSMDSFFKRSNVGLENEPRSSDLFFRQLLSNSESTSDIEDIASNVININKEMKSAENGEGGFSILYIDLDGDHANKRKDE